MKRRWRRNIRRIAAVVIPFAIISLLMLFALPIAMGFWQFWVADVLLSLFATFTICRNLLMDDIDEDKRK